MEACSIGHEDNCWVIPDEEGEERAASDWAADRLFRRGWVARRQRARDRRGGLVSRSGASAASTSERGRSELSSPLGWVRNLQRDLVKLHFYSGPINGFYTAATKAAVIRFQKAEHLAPDGEWGEKSQAALDKALGRKPSAPVKTTAPLGWVRNLQRDLVKLHFYSGPISGRYTAATKAAVIRFQNAEHLIPDGEWGKNSQAALDKALHRTG